MALLLLLVGCTAGAPGELAGGPLDERVFVTSNGWHTQIVVERADLAAGILPEARDLADTPWLAVGWGEHEYYPDPDPSWRLALQAALLPTPAVLHLVPLETRPRPGPEFEVLEVGLTSTAYDVLLAALDDSVARKGWPQAPVAAPGRLPGSRFYPAEGTFHIFNTCNQWVADQLALAGVPLSGWGVITADDLMRQLRGLAMVSPVGG